MNRRTLDLSQGDFGDTQLSLWFSPPEGEAAPTFAASCTYEAAFECDRPKCTAPDCPDHLVKCF